jgi:uroporphyrin-III C-methyltransferase/precorrin-2 dehydrogenase/sirohydrochlorin ferrochelatase
MAVRDRIADGLAGGALDPGVTPATAPGVTPATAPGVTPATAPGVTPATAPGATPATAPGVTPEPAASDPRMGSVTLIGAGPGDPELITVKGRRLLATATVVVVDHLAPGLLLDELGPHVEVVDASKLPYGPQRAQEEINRILVDRAGAGHTVARLKGGDPYVFGRGGEEVLACVAAGVPVTVVSGVTSAFAAPAAAGIPVTHRGVTHEVVVVAGHLPPGDPQSLVDWPALARLRGTVCVLMGLKNLSAIAAALIKGGRDGATPAAVVQDGTTEHQRTVHAPLAKIAAATAAAGLRSPAIVVIGAVAELLPLSDRAHARGGRPPGRV